MSTLWQRDQLLAAVGGKAIGQIPMNFSGVSIDSRTVTKGDMFFAIKGVHFDGHKFAENAYRNGAAVLIVDLKHEEEMKDLNAPLIIVDDVLGALEKLATAARARSQAKIIAITGSVGKTTTKEALRHSLQALGRVHANPASFNNQWGVPLTLARMPVDCAFGIFEIGMNHSGEIRHLVKLVQPHIALITLTGTAHLENFNNVDEIADAKAEIFEGVIKGGMALINADDKKFQKLYDKALACGIKDIRSFGESEEADYRLSYVRLLPDCSCLKMSIQGLEAMIKIGAPGRHIVQNCLAVIGASDMLKCDIAKIALALTTFSAETGRGARFHLALPKGGSFILIDESYNANPISMRAALELLAATDNGRLSRKIAILGDMLELGKAAPDLHRALLEPIHSAGVQLLFLVGTQMRHLDLVAQSELQTIWRSDVADIIPLIIAEIRDGDAVMVKSSNSIGTSKIVAAILDRFERLAR